MADLAYAAKAESSQDDEPPITPDDVANLEKGRSRLGGDKLYWLLRGLLFSDEEANDILRDENFINGVDALVSGNGHLLPANRIDLFVGEFGPAVQATTARVNADFATTWLEADKAAAGGYRPDDLLLLVGEGPVNGTPKSFLGKVAALEAAWEQRRRAGKTAPFNGPTLALIDAVQHQDYDERNLLTLHLRQSKYSWNSVAKGPDGANERWHALQEIKHPAKPEGFLASGLGVAINVICDGGKTIVIGQRSTYENFRKGEYDVAVVEGVRPTANLNQDGTIDIYGVIDRALVEELGIDLQSVGFLKRKVIFEFGCDLKYYQWNFLAYVELNLSFEEVLRYWQTAKDRKETQTLISIDNTRAAVESFVLHHNIWSCGVACLLRSFSYFDSTL